MGNGKEFDIDIMQGCSFVHNIHIFFFCRQCLCFAYHSLGVILMGNEVYGVFGQAKHIHHTQRNLFKCDEISCAIHSMHFAFQSQHQITINGNKIAGR